MSLADGAVEATQGGNVYVLAENFRAKLESRSAAFQFKEVIRQVLPVNRHGIRLCFTLILAGATAVSLVGCLLIIGDAVGTDSRGADRVVTFLSVLLHIQLGVPEDIFSFVFGEGNPNIDIEQK